MEKDQINSETLLKTIFSNLPEFHSFLKKEDYTDYRSLDNEVLYHVLMGYLSQFFIKSYKARKYKLCKKIVGFLEKLYVEGEVLYQCEKENIQNLISVSFLESLSNSGKDYEGIKKMLTPKLRESIEVIDNWEPYPGPFDFIKRIFRKLQ